MVLKTFMFGARIMASKGRAIRAQKLCRRCSPLAYDLRQWRRQAIGASVSLGCAGMISVLSVRQADRDGGATKAM